MASRQESDNPAQLHTGLFRITAAAPMVGDRGAIVYTGDFHISGGPVIRGIQTRSSADDGTPDGKDYLAAKIGSRWIGGYDGTKLHVPIIELEDSEACS